MISANLIRTAALTGVAALAIPAVALADSGPIYSSNHVSGSARVVSTGNNVYICDHQADGHSVVVQYKRDGDRAWSHHLTDSSGSVVGRICHTRHFNVSSTGIQTNVFFRYRVCLADHGKRGGVRMKIIAGSCGRSKRDVVY